MKNTSQGAKVIPQHLNTRKTGRWRICATKHKAKTAAKLASKGPTRNETKTAKSFERKVHRTAQRNTSCTITIMGTPVSTKLVHVSLGKVTKP